MKFKSPDKFNNLTPTAVAVFSTAFAIGLFVFIYLGFFSRYGADDYCFSGTLFKSDNILQATTTWYSNTSNRYTTMLLVGASEWFGRSAISFLPALAILSWLASLTWTLSHFSRKLKFPFPAVSGFALAAVIVFFSILEAPSRYQSLYWRSGMVTYFVPLIFFSYLIGFVLTETWREQKRPPLGQFLVPAWVGFGFFFAGGLSETTLAIQGGALGLSILAVWFFSPADGRKKSLPMLITALIASIIALVIIFIAPANAIRIDAFGPSPALLGVFSYSLIYAWDFMRETFKSLPTPTMMSLIAAVSLGVGLWKEESPLTNRKTFTLALIAIPLITYLLIFFSMLPSMYGQHTYPGARSLMASRSLMVSGLMGLGLTIGFGLRMGINKLTAGQKLSRLAPLLSFFLLLASSLYPLYTANKTMNELMPWYRSHAEIWDQRDAQIRQSVAAGETDLVVIQIDDMDGVMEYKENNWVNLCAAEFYGLNSLSAP
ncbi:MAG: hypothetical protein HY864_11850 [Chloroflexi bacterium]|nr:hypothetical protein [Chloroflexota bacterium]